MASQVRQISMDEVRKHNKKDNVWIVVYNSVYDVTPFLNEHPGGEDTLIENAGTDSTIPFENVGHSQDARDMMKKYKIGELIIEDAKGKINYKKYIPYAIGAVAVGFIIGFGIKRFLR